ncbi:hypothetical protein [Pleurocapsa sp. PCC 7319]|uniref:hypothetical protein n=1 Tax=Pleurocapsa sp. PCC 7319 TaxID=118161 RepID=UPI0003798085|nr:hypothetical protein [Pleurocapsa sp. PCC 7319]
MKNNQSKRISAKDLCEELNKISQQKTWNKSTATHFIDLIINPDRQYQLNNDQKKSLIESIKNCPKNAQSFIHLGLIIENFMSSTGIRTLDDIIPEITNFIKEKKLELKSQSREELQKLEGDHLVNWFEKELNSKQEKEKIDFLRNFLAYLIGIKKTSELTRRELSIADLLSAKKSSISEAERLIRFESYNQILITQQTHKIKQLNINLAKEQKISSQRRSNIVKLELHCQELEKKLEKTHTKLEELQAKLEQEKVLYNQLKSSSTAKISQQRNSALSQVKSRLDHELDKLERFFNSDSDSFQSNRQLGLKIINKIREQLSISDNI